MIFVVSPPTESTEFLRFSPTVLIFALYIMVTKPSKFSPAALIRLVDAHITSKFRLRDSFTPCEWLLKPQIFACEAHFRLVDSQEVLKFSPAALWKQMIERFPIIQMLWIPDLKKEVLGLTPNIDFINRYLQEFSIFFRSVKKFA